MYWNFPFVTHRRLSPDKTIRLTNWLGTRAPQKNCHPVESFVRNFCRSPGKVVVWDESIGVSENAVNSKKIGVFWCFSRVSVIRRTLSLEYQNAAMCGNGLSIIQYSLIKFKIPWHFNWNSVLLFVFFSQIPVSILETEKYWGKSPLLKKRGDFQKEEGLVYSLLHIELYTFL